MKSIIFAFVLVILNLGEVFGQEDLLSGSDTGMNPTNTIINEFFSFSEINNKTYNLVNGIYRAEVSETSNSVLTYGGVRISDKWYTLYNTTEAHIIDQPPGRNTFAVNSKGTFLYSMTSGSPSKLIKFNILTKSVEKAMTITDMIGDDSSRIFISDDSKIYFTVMKENEGIGALGRYLSTEVDTLDCIYDYDYGIAKSATQVTDDVFIVSTLRLRYQNNLKVSKVSFDEESNWNNQLTFNNSEDFLGYSKGVAIVEPSRNVLYRLDCVNGTQYFYSMNMTTGEIIHSNTVYTFKESLNTYKGSDFIRYHNDKIYMDIKTSELQRFFMIFNPARYEFEIIYYINVNNSPELIGYFDNKVVMVNQLVLKVVPINSINALKDYEIVYNNITVSNGDILKDYIGESASLVKKTEYIVAGVNHSLISYRSDSLYIPNISYNLGICTYSARGSDFIIDTHSCDFMGATGVNSDQFEMYKRGIDGYTYDEDHSVYQEVDGYQFFDVRIPQTAAISPFLLSYEIDYLKRVLQQPVFVDINGGPEGGGICSEDINEDMICDNGLISFSKYGNTGIKVPSFYEVFLKMSFILFMTGFFIISVIHWIGWIPKWIFLDISQHYQLITFFIILYQLQSDITIITYNIITFGSMAFLHSMVLLTWTIPSPFLIVLLDIILFMKYGQMYLSTLVIGFFLLNLKMLISIILLGYRKKMKWITNMSKIYILLFDTDQILFPYLLYYFVSYGRIILITENGHTKVTTITIAIISAVIISVFSVMLLANELSILRDWSIANIHGEATNKMQRISQIYNFKNTPAALLARFNRIATNLVSALVTTFLVIPILLISCIVNGEFEYLLGSDKLALDIIFFFTMIVFNLLWVLYLVMVRPYSSRQQNISVIINSMIQLTFLILLSLHSGFSGDDGHMFLNVQIISLSLFPYSLAYLIINWIVTTTFKCWRKYRKNDEYERLEEDFRIRIN